MKNAMLKWIPLIVLLAPMQSWAAPITYDIEFTASEGNAPTAAEFTYDAATTTLTGFSVTWEGFTFGNFSYGGALCGYGAAGAFALLTRSCPESAVYIWAAQAVASNFRFRFLTSGTMECDTCLEDRSVEPDFFNSAIAQGGEWSSIPRATSVPEPGTLALLGLGLAGLGFRRSRRKTEV